jgi:hypothetical protein
MVLIKTARYIFGKWQIYNISKIKTKQHDETYDLTSFMANPTAQMLKNIKLKDIGNKNFIALSERA